MCLWAHEHAVSLYFLTPSFLSSVFYGVGGKSLLMILSNLSPGIHLFYVIVNSTVFEASSPNTTFFIDVYVIYNVVLISGVQQSDSVLYIAYNI